MFFYNWVKGEMDMGHKQLTHALFISSFAPWWGD